MTPIRKPLPVDKRSQLQRDRMAGHLKNRMNIRTTPSIPPGLVGRQQPVQPMKKGGKVKCMAKGGSASKRADGCATKGKTKGRII